MVVFGDGVACRARSLRWRLAGALDRGEQPRRQKRSVVGPVARRPRGGGTREYPRLREMNALVLFGFVGKVRDD